MSNWKPPSHWTEEELEHWKSLDHSMCTMMHGPEEPQLEPYERCLSAHCPRCGLRTGGGHLAGEGGKRGWACPLPEGQRKPWPQPGCEQ